MNDALNPSEARKLKRAIALRIAVQATVDRLVPAPLSQDDACGAR